MENYSVLMTVCTKDNPIYFSLALDSMMHQTLLPNEIVLVKDGPVVDILQKVIDDYILTGAPIVQVQLPKNQGLGLALNEGLKVVKNELIARMDSDDYSMPERCELQVREFQKNQELDIIGCQVLEFECTIDNIVGERKVPLTNEAIYRYAKKRDPFNHPTVMYRKSTIERVGCYSNYRKNQDTDLWIKMLSNHANCKNLAEAAFLFRFDESTYKKRKSWINTKILVKIRYKAWKTGFNSLGDFLMVAIAQLGICIMPIGIQKFLYRKVLRSQLDTLPCL